VGTHTPNTAHDHMRKIERREWWLWASAVLVTLLLTLGIVSAVLPIMKLEAGDFESLQMHLAVRGLIGLVLLFDLYTIYQQFQIHSIRRQLDKQGELFRLITENAADMIAVVDANGQRVYNSPSYERILGFTPEDLLATSAFEQIHPDDRQRVIEAAGEARRTGVGRRIEYRMQHKDGSWRFLESTANAVLDSEGKVDKLVVVNRDITGRKKLEEQFRQSQKMEAIGRLSGGIAHDFNNLLGVIIGYSEILQDRLPTTDALRDSVDEILGAGKRAASLTRQLLAFSRQQVLEPRILDLNGVVSDLEKMLRRLIGEDIELTTVLEPTLGKVRADQGQLEQVILNLAVNARDAMPQGGKLTIATANTIMDENSVRRYSYPVPPGPYILLTVTDSGIGMDAATKARVFEPFFTTKEKGKGTGLGLSTVYGVVKQSGGYIEFDSEPGKGTNFKIHLPRADEFMESEKASPAKAAPARETGTVLLVEDEKSLRILTRNLLELSGYTVLEAKDGSEALETSRKHTGSIDLLLTDIVMPGISGRALAQQLSQQRPEMKVVLMSGYTGQSIGEKEYLERGSFFLQKPFTRESLAHKIREAMAGGRAA
jgi:two-component system cell cycle sensor histidine kinase/response regulator CckA